MRARAALTIAGLDPSGGAGIAADLRAFAAADVWGAAVCAALTVQSTRGLKKVEAVASSLVLAQAEEVLGDLDVRAIKTGALGSSDNARAVVSIACQVKAPLIVDPVMLPSRGRGARLDGGLEAMRALAYGATLVTPNLREAAALLGASITSDAEARAAAKALVANGARAALVKGGHGSGARAIDFLATRRGVVAIERPRVRGPEIHGTGCTLASLIAGKIAATVGRSLKDEDLERQVRWARARLHRAIVRSIVVGRGMRVLSPA